MASIIGTVAQITVSLLSAGVREANFGIPLIADFHTRFSEVIRFYTDQSGMLTDGFTASDAAYVAVGQVFAQSPTVERVAVGRRALMPTLSTRLTPVAVNNKSYKVKVTAPSGTVTTVQFTSDGTATVAEICTGLAGVIDALTGVAATGVSGTFVDVTAETPGQYFAVEVVEDGASAGFANLAVKQTHADPGIATDLGNIKLMNNDFYGVTLTSQGAAEIDAASAWCETNDKMFLQATQESECLAGTTGDIMSTVKTANRMKSGIIFHQNPTQHVGAAWMGDTFALDPGSLTFAFRRLSNVDASPLSTTAGVNIESKRGNYIADLGGVAVTWPGKGSGGEWLDVIRDLDWYENQLQTEFANNELANDKIPMTDDGIAIQETALRAATGRAESAGVLDPAFTTYTVPKVASLSAGDRAARTLKTLKASSRLAGAIHITQVTATVTA